MGGGHRRHQPRAGGVQRGSTGGTTVPGGSGSAAAAVRGGTLNMLGAGDVDYMDPNISYYSVGYTATAAVEPPAVHLPGHARSGDPARARPRHRDADRRQGREQRRPDLHDRHPARAPSGAPRPARQVTAADMVRGVKRTCNPVQPFGGLPDYQDLIVGFQAVLRRVRQGRQHGGRDLGLHEQDRPSRCGRQGRPHRRVQAGAPSQLLPRHAHADRLLAGAEGVRRVRPGAAPSSGSTRSPTAPT